MYTGGLYLEQKMRRKLSSHFAQVLLYIYNKWCRWCSESTRTTSPNPNTAQKPRNKTMEEAESYEAGVSGITESWGLKLLCYLLCLQGSDTEEKESRSSVTSSPNDKQIDPALWLWQSKQG